MPAPGPAGWSACHCEDSGGGRPPRGLLEVLDEIAREYRGRAREDPLEAFLRERR